MSAHRLPITLSPRARRDFANILLYTLQQWGAEQEAAYAETLRRALLLIEGNPEIGRARDDLRPNARAFPAGQHIIIYLVQRDKVSVARILHQRANARRAL